MKEKHEDPVGADIGEPKASGAEPKLGIAEFLDWMALEGHLELVSKSSVLVLKKELSLEDPEILYEMLLESDEVDDIFVSETEFKSLLRHFRSQRSE